ncbi:MAG TPA: hypothetical protein PKW55_03315 [Spirochaetota bacterium]|nr:hypothetical protein [Spirochaetota bacterium]HOM38135.1 hypothetical protein [Spirochaetota bacterium]HPQ48938.1 hypothetical protein [Spirochaetota bacterium]
MIIKLSDYNINTVEIKNTKKEKKNSIPKIFLIIVTIFSLYLLGHYLNTSSLIEEKKHKIEELKKIKRELIEKNTRLDFRLNNSDYKDYKYIIKIINEDKLKEEIEKIKKEIEKEDKKDPYWVYYLGIIFIAILRLIYIYLSKKNKKKQSVYNIS